MLGASERTIEDARARLHVLGLLTRQVDTKGIGRWFPSMPVKGLAQPPAELRGSAVEAWLREQTVRLDAALATAETAVAERRQATEENAEPAEGISGLTAKSAGAHRRKCATRPQKMVLATEEIAAAEHRGECATMRSDSELAGPPEPLVDDRVYDRVGDLVGDEVTHGVSDFRSLSFAGAPLAGRTVTRSSGGLRGTTPVAISTVPAPASAEPDEFTGWIIYRAAIANATGGIPSGFDEANERAAYRRHRRGGVSHRSLMERLTAQREMPA
jgi:hypothetical protein